ncbi:putative polypeptide N-acetylgalactosaminyltransferase 10 isoform X1 [Portunus trituberculatus]|uniref:putative polypeptide N-acetylgalactosaminyltransferase 10 isoform X1 n=1 Tax=Portunus trituberculatus TaxID=210409 RepID=UPI001E1CEC53|nr:putative polypeptide N-acetylgalactosaminyltransferase 10 isoform X1 [Portunus trituberculatus]XP_045137959.1 putative polypeptide N-acetylgalactosaminyltransferase 10 isoform X1 [Portunus trituberculatus]
MRLRRNLIWCLKLGIGVFMFLAGIYIITHHSQPDGHPTKHSEERALPSQEHILASYLDNNKNNVLEKQIASISLKTHVPMHDPEGSKDWNDYALIAAEAKQTGPGEQGQAYILPPNLAAERDQLYRVNGFNARASDDIALNRSLQDLRHPKCRDKKYLTKLPRASVIVPFHNEHWSTLLRTAVSAINRAPESLLLEVILVDDASTKGFLKNRLDDYVRANLPKVRVLRLGQRSGLIRARLAGARAAQGEVLIFLDSHTECTTNWLPPLLEPITKDYRTCVCPFIDVIDYETFAYRAQDEGARGAFDWELFYKRLPLLPEDVENMPEPFRSPVMAGGLFAISSKFFWELGGYDPGLDIWGGEQYELSFKIWQCGGTLVDSPCSRIGHIYRKFAPFPNPGVGNFVGRNYRRVAEVWMDEYAEYLYKRRPSYRSIDPGDLTQQRAIRMQLKCQSFSWFMKEVAFDLTKVYPPVEPPDYAAGKVQNVANPGLCVDCGYKHHGERFGLKECGWGGEQEMHLTWHQDIRPGRRSICWDVSSGDPQAPVLLYNCHGMGGNQLWKYDPTQQWLVHGGNPRCLDTNPDNKELFVSACDPTKNTQRWKFEKFDHKHLKKLEKN